MQALGLIETRGLIAAIESADAMLKAAEVTLLEKTHVGGGLVTVAVTGDVGAVKAAVEAGAAAVRKLNNTLLLSEHVIPRPHQELEDVIVSTAMLNQGEPELEKEPETEIEPKPAMDAEPDAEAKPEEESEAEILAEKESETISLTEIPEELHKEAVDKIASESGWKAAMSVLNGLKVVKLRNLAREYKDFSIAGRMISKADKQMILTEFEKYYGQN